MKQCTAVVGLVRLVGSLFPRDPACYGVVILRQVVRGDTIISVLISFCCLYQVLEKFIFLFEFEFDPSLKNSNIPCCCVHCFAVLQST